MKNLFVLSLTLLFLLQTPLASAHAVVTDYSLKINPIQANRADKIELSFNSKIELGLSQVFLVSKGDSHKLLHLSKGSKQGQIVIDVPALAPGKYAIKLKVFAADGHLTEDVIHFVVTR